MNIPSVSLVIPSYNSARFLAATLDSALAQDYPKVEIVVVDDGSTDNTREIVKTYCDRIVYVHQENGGLGAARNVGMQVANGQYIAWLDADDICRPERVGVQAAYLEHRADVVAVGSNFTEFTETCPLLEGKSAATYYSQIAENGLEELFPQVEQFDGSGVPWLPKPFASAFAVHFGQCWQQLVLGNFIHPPTLMIRREARERIGWLDPQLRSFTDCDYIARLAEVGSMAFIDAPLLAYRRHSDQMSTAQRSYEAQLLQIRWLERIVFENEKRFEALRGKVQRTLATYHEEAVYGLADRSKIDALRHLLIAARHDYRSANVTRNLGRILAGSQGRRLLRRLRHPVGTASSDS